MHPTPCLASQTPQLPPQRYTHGAILRFPGCKLCPWHSMALPRGGGWFQWDKPRVQRSRLRLRYLRPPSVAKEQARANVNFPFPPVVLRMANRNVLGAQADKHKSRCMKTTQQPRVSQAVRTAKSNKKQHAGSKKSAYHSTAVSTALLTIAAG